MTFLLESPCGREQLFVLPERLQAEQQSTSADRDAEQARERAQEQAAAEADARRLDGPLGWIRALRSGGVPL
ncbi:hypothetical protein [Streptomyces sp. NPDC093093]|uniref:hypothetical protein n=1 Tax=Streptomyces sp. NPDC093093 TaxID=3366025 RepID=UPI0037F13E39